MRVTVSAPATVANVGPGFDCLALALGLASEFTADTEGEPAVVIEGEGAAELPSDATNLVVRTMTHLARETGGSLPPLQLTSLGRIPLQRGLGSSAAAVVGGLLLGDRVLGTALPPDRLLELAIGLEGHPDNAAACLRGGLALAWLSQDGWRCETLEPNPELQPVVLVPESERVATEEARRVLPETVPLADATFNVSRAALAVLALTRRPDLLAPALEDRLHQERRFALMPSARGLFQDLREAGFPVCVAGSGPTLLAFETPGRELWDLGPGWRVLRPGLSPKGATATVVV